MTLLAGDSGPDMNEALRRVRGIPAPARPARPAPSPLYDGRRVRLSGPTPVDIARTVARRILNDSGAADIHDHSAMVGAASALHTVLQDLLASLDARDGGQR
ncbi:hypothetical protein PV350_14510 [Streptomyces sp. PA03-6a]|nr:hypothetical protein [Streptomyces sp. PA03-6a]